MSQMTQRILQRLTMTASTAVERGTLVKLGAAQGAVEQCDVQGEDAWGVAEHSADATETISIIRGLVWVLAGANLSVGDDVTTGADSRVEAAGAGDVIIGKALMSGADGELVLIDTERRGAISAS